MDSRVALVYRATLLYIFVCIQSVGQKIIHIHYNNRTTAINFLNKESIMFDRSRFVSALINMGSSYKDANDLWRVYRNGRIINSLFGAITLVGIGYLIYKTRNK